MAALTRKELRSQVRARIKSSRLSSRGFAISIGANIGHLCTFLKHGREPIPSLLSALGYRRVESEFYELKGQR